MSSPTIAARSDAPTLSAASASTTRKAAFWDRVARKYAADPIADMAGYEATLRRVQTLLTDDQDVLEIGCGTGTTALRLAPSVRRMLATDVSALVAQFDPGRKDKDTSTLNPTPGDKRLTGMGNVQTSTEAGVGAGYRPMMLVARQSLGERGPNGAQVDLTVEIPWSLSDRFGLRFALGATWADQDYMQTYFGVTAAQAQATSFSAAMADGKSGSGNQGPAATGQSGRSAGGDCNALPRAAGRC